MVYIKAALQAWISILSASWLGLIGSCPQDGVCSVGISDKAFLLLQQVSLSVCLSLIDSLSLSISPTTCLSLLSLFLFFPLGFCRLSAEWVRCLRRLYNANISKGIWDFYTSQEVMSLFDSPIFTSLFSPSAIIENMAEFRPGLCTEAAQQGLMQWLLKRIKVRL